MTAERHHLQRFGTSVAESLLRPDLAVGWDRGRRHEASLDQYVPFTAHVAEPDGATTAFGVMLPTETRWADVERVGDLEFLVRAMGRADTVGLRIVGPATAELIDGQLRIGRVTVTFEDAPVAVVDSSTHGRPEVIVRWSIPSVIARISIAH